MSDQGIDACVAVDISDDDVYEAMKTIPGYLDITPGDFKEIYVRAYREALLRLSRSVKAADVMTRDVAAVREDANLTDVARTMASRKISGVPVVRADGTVAGVISEKDFLTAMAGDQAGTFMGVVFQCLEGSACLVAPVQLKTAADMMSSPAITVPDDMPVMDVAGIFGRRNINRVPVVDRNGRLVGIVSRGDIVRSRVLGEGR
ncbi:MAG: CBS domain-containing protein [Pseudomonadota bacterium]